MSQLATTTVVDIASVRDRKLREKYVDRMQAIERKSFPKKDSTTMPSITTELRKRNNTCAIVMDTTTSVVCGYVIFSNKDSTGYIVQIAVAESHRRQGIGARLLEFALDKLTRCQRCGCVQLHVEIHRTAAVELYKKMGFTVMQTLTDYYGDSRDAFLMQI